MLPDSMLRGFGSELHKIGKEVKPSEAKAISREVEVFNKLRGASPVKVRVDSKADAHGGGYFDTRAKSIGVSRKDYESLAHELGHAEMDKRIWGKMLQHPLAQGAFPWTPIAGVLGGVLAAGGKNIGLALPALTAGPKLLSEALATREGVKRLEEAGVSKKAIKKYKKNLRDSYATYTAAIPIALLAMGLGAMTGKHILRAASKAGSVVGRG